jgi:hypothetical protein
VTLVHISNVRLLRVNTHPNVFDSLNYIYEVFKYPFPNIDITPVTNKEIKDIIKSLKWKSSQGYDEIPQNILKVSMPFILSL